VDAAAFFLALDSARQYGLLTSDVMVNIERCDELLKRGNALGYSPKPIDALIAKYLLSK
jgi:hypothetical protein